MIDFLRNLTKSEAEKRQEMLTAYLDNALTPEERDDFEALLRSDSALQASLEQQRQIKQNISQLPRMRAPRNFTLDPAVYGRPTSQRVYTLYPVLRTATVLAAVLFIFLFSLEFFPGAQRDFETTSEQIAASETADDPDADALEESPGETAEREAPAPPAGQAGAEEAVESGEEAAEEMSAADTAEEVAEAETVEQEVAVPAEPAAPAEGDAAANGFVTGAAESPPPAPETAGADATVEGTITITQSEILSPEFSYTARTVTAPEELDRDLFSPTQSIPTAAINNNELAQVNRFDSSNFLKIGLGTLFVLLLAATLLLRRQL